MSARVKVEPGCSSGGNHLVEHMSTSAQRICYVCGGGGALYPLNIRPRERGSYFQFLEQYEIPQGACRPDADGVVVACSLCYSFLTQQWESFERSRTPHSKRMYWLKRTDNGHYIGAEMRLQGEYASQVIGMSPEPGNRGGPGGQHGHCFPMVNSPVMTSSSRHSAPVNRVSQSQPGYSNVQSAPTASNNSSNKEFYRENRPNSGTTLNQSASSHNNEDLYDSSSLLLDLRSGSNVGGGKEFNNLLKSRDGRHQGEQTQQLFKTETNSKQGEAHVANGALDLSMPDKNASTEVCYLCGEDVLRGTLVSIYAKPITNCPFFPSLLLHPRPSRSHPMDHSGCVQACGPCHQYLLQQWDALQRQNVPHSERHYRLRKHSNAHYSPRMRPVTLSPHTPSPMQPAIPTHTSSAFICFLCGQEFAWNQRRVLYSGPNSEGEPPLHFLERVKPSRGALPLSTTGEALTCSSCYKAAHKQRHAYVDSLRNSTTSDEQQQHHSRSQHHQHHSHQPQQHHYNQRNQETDKYNKHNRDESHHKLVCQICRQPVSKRYVKYLRNPPESGKPICPSLVQGEDEGFPVCPTCHTSLLNRWEAVEDGRPVAKHYASASQNEVNNRKMMPTSNSADVHRNGGGGHVNLDMALRIKVPTPDNDIIRLHQNQHTHGSGVTLLTTISNRSGSPVNLTYNQFPPDDAKSSSATATPTTSSLLPNALDLSGASRSATVPLESSSSSKKSRRDSVLQDNSFVCYVCGFHIKSGRSYTIHSYPLKSKDGLDTPPTPFFPFLTMHLAPPDADPVADDGTVTTCTFCYHSLMEQWVAYETTVARHPQDRNPWSRQFNCRDYVCYVCGVSTYRKRVDSIRVADFTFLVEHSRPLGSLVLDGGESVVVCLMCYDTLSVQWHDFERMKVPIELRKYNWITSPPPPEDENMTSRHRKVNGENVPESRHGVKSEDELDTRLRDGSVRQHHTGKTLSFIYVS